MKKNYFLTLLIIFITSLSFGQDLIITGAYDGPNTGGTPKGVELYVVNDIADLSIYGIGSANNGGGTDGVEFTFPADAVTAGTFIYVASEDTQFTAFFGVAPDYNAGSAMGINGDDAVELFKNAVVVDTFGDINKDGTGEPWDHVNGWAYRKDATGPDGGFVLANWTFSGTNQLVGGSTNGATTAPFPKGTYKKTVSITPTLAFTAPTDNKVFAAGTTTIPITFNVGNFTLSGDNGSEMTDNTGDGYIVGTLHKNGAADGTKSIFSGTVTEVENANDGDTFTVTAELVDNAGNSLSPKVEATVNFSVSLPCDLVLGEMTTTCDAITSGTDTFSGSIAFTGGNTGAVYTITAPVGTVVGGDNPSTAATGTITFTQMTEGVDAAISIVGDATSACNYNRTLSSPICKPFPVYEPFDYTVGTDLIASSSWANASTSSDEIKVVAATLGNPFGAGQFPDPTGNMVNFGGAGSDSYIEFNAQSSGLVYASFIFTATDISTLTDTTDGGYFAALGESGGSFRARLYLRQNATDNTMYELGISESSSATNFNTTVTYTPGEETFVVMEYNLDSDEIRVFVNPDPATFEAASAPVSGQSLYHASATPAADIGRFIIRQDSSGETPDTNFDELRIGTTWAHVTPKDAAASIAKNSIEGFTAYPNPVNNGRLTVTTSNSNEKEVSIYNVLGKRVFTQKFSGSNKQLDVSQINSGIYIMKVIEGDKVATKKLIIK